MIDEQKDEPQSIRLESELRALRSLFKSAEAAEEVQPMVALSRVILQHEKEISKLKLAEGRTLDREAVMEYQAKLVGVISTVAQKFISEAQYGQFVDQLVAQLESIED
jgi:hypothetical protein